MKSSLDSCHSNNLYERLHKILRESHPMEEVGVDLYRELEIIQSDREKLTRIIDFKMYTVCIQFDGLKQTTQIPEGLFIETCKYTLVWANDWDYEVIAEPIEIEYSDFDCHTFIEWESPELPPVITQNTCAAGSFGDELQLAEDLIEYYGNLEDVNLGEFPKPLIPLIKRSIVEYKKYNRFYGFPKLVI